jgi:hypothetical protein
MVAINPNSRDVYINGGTLSSVGRDQHVVTMINDPRLVIVVPPSEAKQGTVFTRVLASIPKCNWNWNWNLSHLFLVLFI